jgi:hypothetical protein
MICSATKKDGTPCKGKARDSGLCIFHERAAIAVNEEGLIEIVQDAPVGKPAFLKGVKRTRASRFGHRRIKMLRPSCDQCSGPMAPRDWYLTCEHDPYVGVREIRRQVPTYSEPDENGERTVLGMEEKVSWEPFPNRAAVSLANNINSGEGMERARRKGYIMPEELRSPAFPNGIAPFCQFHNCWWQHGLQQYNDGVFCNRDEAVIVAQYATNRDATGSLRYGAVEAMHPGKIQAHRERVVV